MWKKFQFLLNKIKLFTLSFFLPYLRVYDKGYMNLTHLPKNIESTLMKKKS
jgi:hypothetical protein